MFPASRAHGFICLRIGVIASVLLSAFQSTICTAEEPKAKASAEDLLLHGRYREIQAGQDVHGKALWAFAQFHLAPSGKVYNAAWEAHQKDELLGTFVAWQCQRDGVGARRDEKLMWRIHFQLREKLEKKKDPSPLELYILAQLDPVDAEGVMKLPEGTQYDEFEKKNTARKHHQLEQSANAGFAQACEQLAINYQRAHDFPDALTWFDKAIQLGHGGAMRSKGFMLMIGQGTDKDPKKAFELATRAADAGDAFGMINLAVYYDKGWGTAVDQKKAQSWLDKAAESGHWAGRIERGRARCKGAYGFAVDTKLGEEDWRQAVALRHRDVLDFLTHFYAEGDGVPKNGQRAVHFAEAAFVQGSPHAAELLAQIYDQGLAGVAKDEKLREYWSIQSNPSFAFTFAKDLEKRHPEVNERLKKLDPWEWGK
jgi:TPR repeat protein